MNAHYSVIGRPISHTKSPLIHGLFAEMTQQDLTYVAIEGEPEGFEAQVLAFRDAGGSGMNVTAPFKLQAFELADVCSERARLARASNALKFENGQIHADNFDGIGLLRDIEHNLHVCLAGRRVLVLGAGGAVRGALLPFLAARPEVLVIANRDIDKAYALAREVDDARVRVCAYDMLPGQSFDVVVNATSASLAGELPPISTGLFQQVVLAYELAYGKGLTPFLRLAQDAGVAQIADGVGMLVEQAAEAFAWWRGIRPETREVIERLTVPLK